MFDSSTFEITFADIIKNPSESDCLIVTNSEEIGIYYKVSDLWIDMNPASSHDEKKKVYFLKVKN